MRVAPSSSAGSLIEERKANVSASKVVMVRADGMNQVA